MRNLDNGEFKRIRKDVARRLYNEGRTIYLTPSNVVASDSNFWIKPFPINLKEEAKRYNLPLDHKDLNFDSRVNGFEYYNCYDSELGYYTNFWIKKGEVK